MRPSARGRADCPTSRIPSRYTGFSEDCVTMWPLSIGYLLGLCRRASSSTWRNPGLEFAATVANLLRDLGRALVERQEPGPMKAAVAAIEAYVAASREVRSMNLDQDPTVDLVGRVFAIVFALEQIQLNLEDLVNRARESARDGGPPM